MSDSNPTYSVVVPVYNTAKSLEELAERVKEVFEKTVEGSYELILVNDGSSNPETWPILEALCDADPNVRAFRLTRNFGQSPATVCGLEQSRGQYVITMDDDLQHRPEDIPLLIEQKEHQIVIGKLKKKKHSLFKRVTSRLKEVFDRYILGKPKGLRMSSFRLFNRTIVDGMLSIRTPYPFIPALMFYVSRDAINVSIQHEVRKEGKTGYSLRKMFQLFSNLIINNSSLLLRVIGNFGIVLSLASFIGGAYYVGKKLIYGIDVPGWTSVMVALLIIGGGLLFTMGIIGEYLIRIVQGVEHKPTYIILEKRGE